MTSRADKEYYSAEHLRWLDHRGLASRIAHPGIESGEPRRPAPWEDRAVSIAWLFSCSRLAACYERKGNHFLAFLGASPQPSPLGLVHTRDCNAFARYAQLQGESADSPPRSTSFRRFLRSLDPRASTVRQARLPTPSFPLRIEMPIWGV